MELEQRRLKRWLCFQIYSLDLVREASTVARFGRKGHSVECLPVLTVTRPSNNDTVTHKFPCSTLSDSLPNSQRHCEQMCFAIMSFLPYKSFGVLFTFQGCKCLTSPHSDPRAYHSFYRHRRILLYEELLKGLGWGRRDSRQAKDSGCPERLASCYTLIIIINGPQPGKASDTAFCKSN
jgi:hypothetical protein